MKKKVLFGALLLSSALFVADPVLAQNLGQTLVDSAAGANGAGYGNTSLTTLIGQLIRAILGLLSIIFFLYTLYAGFLWMTAGGESDKVDEAKDILKRSVIGLLIITSAYAISTFVVQIVTGGGSTPVPGA